MLHTTFKGRAQLTRAGHARLTEVLRMNCRLCNQSLAARKSAWLERQENLSLYEQHKVLTTLRQSDPRWQALDRRIGRGTRQLDRAYQASFRRLKPGHPRFKGHVHWRTLEVEAPLSGMLQGPGARPWLCPGSSWICGGILCHPGRP